MNIGSWIYSAIGLVGGFIATMLGGWDAGLTTLIIFMAVDYVSGLVVAGIFKKSTKTDTGALESKAGWKGLCRKVATLFCVLVAVRLDVMMGSNIIRDGVIIAFVANEAISIIENMGLMGVDLPPVLVKAIDVLKNKEESEGK